ncbi:hypothetical protein FM019_20500 [Aliiglaciecola sp. M165]|nr:hypothetical protein FM019_20500 [Aliiglaciecola sp. M165]
MKQPLTLTADKNTAIKLPLGLNMQRILRLKRQKYRSSITILKKSLTKEALTYNAPNKRQILVGYTGSGATQASEYLSG